VPLDVDLEDRLIYGLTPQRFGYLVLAGLAAMALWAQRPLPGALRLPACLLVLGAGLALAFVRWRGRPLDGLLVDLARYLAANYEVRPVRPFRPFGRAGGGGRRQPERPPWGRRRWRPWRRHRPRDHLEVCSSPGLDSR
jgi:hypothetical protein